MIFEAIAKACRQHGVDETTIGWIMKMLKSRVVNTLPFTHVKDAPRRYPTTATLLLGQRQLTYTVKRFWLLRAELRR